MARIVGLLTLLYFSGCELPLGDDNEMDVAPQPTEILEVIVDPNPARVGSTVKIHCVIKDSPELGFTYTWYLQERRGTATNAVETDSCEIEWSAPMQPGELIHTLWISRKTGHYASARAQWNMSVKENS